MVELPKSEEKPVAKGKSARGKMRVPEYSALLRSARRQGIEEDWSGKHVRLTRPGFEGFVIIPSTPGKGRAFQNTVAEMRRVLGFVWKGR
jgi:hypothetical protein